MFDPADRVRAIEILCKHYGRENVLLTVPTEVEIYRPRTGQLERWQVVLWNSARGEFLAWRRDHDGSLKARSVETDPIGRVRGVAIQVSDEQPPPPTAENGEALEQAAPARQASIAPQADEEFEDELTRALAEQYMGEIERKLADTRRGSLAELAGSKAAALRDLERSLRANREAAQKDRIKGQGKGREDSE